MEWVGCIACGRGFHIECIKQPCCCAQNNEDKRVISKREDSSSKELHTATKTDSNKEKHRSNSGNRESGAVTESAGRKRAAVAYEINSTEACEWRGLANCGGGLYPIIGCIAGVQQHRHHGPVKDTTRNEKENVHLICASCHVLWHRRNDEHYDESLYETLPHNPRQATPSEILQRGA